MQFPADVMRCVGHVVDPLTVPEGSLWNHFVGTRIWTAAMIRKSVDGRLNACQQHERWILRRLRKKSHSIPILSSVPSIRREDACVPPVGLTVTSQSVTGPV